MATASPLSLRTTSERMSDQTCGWACTVDAGISAAAPLAKRNGDVAGEFVRHAAFESGQADVLKSVNHNSTKWANA
jgi:hypothetical protein